MSLCQPFWLLAEAKKKTARTEDAGSPRTCIKTVEANVQDIWDLYTRSECSADLVAGGVAGVVWHT